MRLALIKDGIVRNVIVADGAPEWQAIGYSVVASDVAGPGDSWDGSIFTPAPPPPPTVPASVSPRQFVQALTRANLRNAVEAAVAAADQDTKDWYNKSTEFQRGNAVLITMATAMGKTSADIDALFVLAATL